MTSTSAQARQKEPEGPVCHADAGPTRRVPEVGQLLAKREVFERQLGTGVESRAQRSEEAHKQGGHGWIMHEGRQSRLNRSSIVVTVGKMATLMTTWRRTEAQRAKAWVPEGGRPRLLPEPAVTNRKYRVPAVVCVKAPRMKEAWCLATSHTNKNATEIVKLYGRRFTIEESFRDTKDLHFGLGLSATRIGDPERRDRLLLIGALAMALLTLLGAAGESIGMDRMLKANTSKKRTHSLFRQGLLYYDKIPNMQTDQLRALLEAFVRLLSSHPLFQTIFGPI
jgi:hypothetical protein